jgi:hypothetical protein
MSYTPQLVNSTDEVRDLFTPSLSTDDVSEDELLGKIELVENYIAIVYFEGSMPTKAKGRIPALLMIMSRVIKNGNLMKKYGTPDKIKIENYEVSIPHHGTSGKMTTWEDVESWDKMAHRMLSKYDNGNFIFRKVND